MSTIDKLNKVSIVKINKGRSTIGSEQKELLRTLLENVVKELVPYPEDISVRYSCGERTTIYNIDCSPRVMGHLIGARGKNIQSIRNIVQGISSRKGFRSIVEIPYYDKQEALVSE